jgi:hypothetical protein
MNLFAKPALQLFYSCNPTNLLFDISIYMSFANNLRRLLGGLGLVSAELGLGLGLDGSLGSADGRDTLDSGLAEVRSVAVLGGLVGNSLVGPASTRKKSLISMVTYSHF